MSQVADRILGNSLIAGAFTAAIGDRLRVLAYHDVPDGEAFDVQMRWLTRRCTPVGLADVLAAFDGVRKLPRRPVWVTFDDGYPDVVERAQPVLDRLGIRATLFVCPGMVVSGEPHWWQIVEQALAAGARPRVDGREWETTALVAYLKTVPDARRRDVVAAIAQELTARIDSSAVGHQLTEPQLRTWLLGGHTLGNHTWDHPCLDQCDSDELSGQIDRADRWLRSFVPGAPRVFAYPNGDWTPAAEATLVDQQYELAVLFDHRLVTRQAPPLRVSRIRAASDAPLTRFRALASGANPTLFGLVHSRAKQPGGA